MVLGDSICIWTEGSWALGTLYKGLQRALTPYYNIDFYDWSNEITNKELWTDNGWKHYDIILGNSAITYFPETFGLVKKIPQEALNKMIVNIWAEVDHGNNHFIELIKYTNGPIFTSSNKRVKDSIKNVYNINTSDVRVGWHTSDFYPRRNISYINTIGLNGNPNVSDEWCKVKRPEFLIKIAKEANLRYKFLFNSEDEGVNIYNDIDMYVCTSKYDAGPSGIAECALSKIPVISTKTGFGLELNSIRTFETPAEAVKIINELNLNPYKLEDYINEVYNEAIEKFSWNKNLPKYWLPLFKQRLKLNNTQ